MTLILVGEAPSRESIASRPSLALTGSSERNLCRIAGWGWLAYLKRTSRYNLFLDPQPRWDARAAQERASAMGAELEGRRVILLGQKVAAAFGLAGYPSYTWLELDPERPGYADVALMPHPSGRNRAWNDPAERARARAFLEGLL